MIQHIRIRIFIFSHKQHNLIHNDTFPELVQLYSQIPHWVVQADLIRLLLVYFNGGLYADAVSVALNEVL